MNLYREEKLNLDEPLIARYLFAKINEAYEALEQGRELTEHCQLLTGFCRGDPPCASPDFPYLKGKVAPMVNP